VSYKNYKFFVGAALIVISAIGMGTALAATISADSVKAAFLFRFASYVHWPETSPQQSPFVVGVAGAESVAKRLDELAPRVTVRGRRTEVRRVENAQDLDGVQILYVDDASLKRTRALRRAALEKPILLVTDTRAGLDAGGVINFVEAERNVRFEISLIAADRAHLRIDSALLSVAARVERRPQSAATREIGR
jgi:hypothetical protein